jgi:hypothetical protein
MPRIQKRTEDGFETVNAPSAEEIEAARSLLEQFAPKLLKNAPPGPVREWSCGFCHAKFESSDDAPMCPRGCHQGGKSTATPPKSAA